MTTKKLATLEKENKKLKETIKAIIVFNAESISQATTAQANGLSKTAWSYCQGKLELAQEINFLLEDKKPGILQAVTDFFKWLWS